MSKPHLELFPSEFHMLKFFGNYLPKLDVNQSAALAPFLYVYDNKFVLSRNLHEFLTQMEDLTALGINVPASACKGRAFLVFFDKELKDPKDFVANTESNKVKAAVIKEISKETPVVDTTVIKETPVEEKQEVKEEITEEKVNPEKTAILEKAESLRDDSKKAASKAALEAFALEHGVSLSKAKTFDGMLEDLKAAL